MWTQSLGQSLKLLIAVSVVFCVTSAGIFFLQLRSDTKKVSTQAVTTLQSIQKDVTDLKEMTNATLYQVGDVSHETADMVRMEKAYVQQESAQLVQTNRQLNLTLNQLQVTIQHLDQNSQSALEPLPALLNQTKETLAAAQKATEDLGQTTIKVGETVDKIKPVVDNLNGVTAHIDGVTADVQTEVHKFVYPPPQPWYQKYIISPVKLGMRMLTIPLK